MATRSAALALMMTASACLAQTDSPPSVLKAKPEPRRADAAPLSTVTINFQGGTIKDYLDALRKVSDPPANVVASESVMDVHIGEISFRNVDTQTAVMALRWVTEPSVIMVEKVGPEAYAVFSAHTPFAHAAETTTEVMSIRDLIEPLPGELPGEKQTSTPDIVLTAIRTALTTIEGNAADIKFHPDSGLVIVHGSQEQIVTAKNVVDRMTGDVARRRSRGSKTSAARTYQIESEVLSKKKAHLSDQVNRVAAELEAAQAQREKARAEGNQDNIGRFDRQIVLGEERLEQTRRELAATELSYVEAQSRMKALEAAGEGNRAEKSLVVYNVHDMGPQLAERLQPFLNQALESRGYPPAQAKDGDLIITADPDLHAALAQLVKWAHDHPVESPAKRGASGDAATKKARDPR